MRHPLLNYFFIGLLLILSGCAQNPHPLGKPLPDLTYEHLNPYTILGGGVRIQQSYVPDRRTIETVKEFPVVPEALLKRYASHRFVIDPLRPKMVFDIRKASLIKYTEKENLVGFLTGAAEDKYLLDVKLTMSPVLGSGSIGEPYTISLQRELFMPHNTSLANKEFRQFEFLEKVVTDIDKVVTDMVMQRLQ